MELPAHMMMSVQHLLLKYTNDVVKPVLEKQESTDLNVDDVIAELIEKVTTELKPPVPTGEKKSITGKKKSEKKADKPPSLIHPSLCEKKKKIPVPFMGFAVEGQCAQLVLDNGLLTQCKESSLDCERCENCQNSTKCLEALIYDRVACPLYKFKVGKRKPRPYLTVLREKKISAEEARAFLMERYGHMKDAVAIIDEHLSFKGYSKKRSDSDPESSDDDRSPYIKAVPEIFGALPKSSTMQLPMLLEESDDELEVLSSKKRKAEDDGNDVDKKAKGSEDDDDVLGLMEDSYAAEEEDEEVKKAEEEAIKREEEAKKAAMLKKAEEEAKQREADAKKAAMLKKAMEEAIKREEEAKKAADLKKTEEERIKSLTDPKKAEDTLTKAKEDLKKATERYLAPKEPEVKPKKNPWAKLPIGERVMAHFHRESGNVYEERDQNSKLLGTYDEENATFTPVDDGYQTSDDSEEGEDEYDDMNESSEDSEEDA